MGSSGTASTSHPPEGEVRHSREVFDLKLTPWSPCCGPYGGDGGRKRWSRWRHLPEVHSHLLGEHGWSRSRRTGGAHHVQTVQVSQGSLALLGLLTDSKASGSTEPPPPTSATATKASPSWRDAHCLASEYAELDGSRPTPLGQPGRSRVGSSGDAHLTSRSPAASRSRKRASPLSYESARSWVPGARRRGDDRSVPSCGSGWGTSHPPNDPTPRRCRPFPAERP